MNIFIAHATRDREFVEALAKVLQGDGNQLVLPFELATGSDMSSVISSAVRSADAFIAIVTSSNSNIFYELGLAAGANVPMLVAASAHELLPVDLAAVPYVRLTGDDVRDAQVIRHRVKDLRRPISLRPTTFASAEAALQEAARDPQVLELISPLDFERMVVEVLKNRGFAVESLGAGRDAGADFAIKGDAGTEMALVEVKKLNRQSRVSVETVRNLLSAVSDAGASKGLLVTTAGYTAAALALAAKAPILLRTLQDVLAAKSVADLLKTRSNGG